MTGEDKEFIPTVFFLSWPHDVKEFFHTGNITNSDLEMAGLLMLCIVVEEVCPKLQAAYGVFSRKQSKTVGWIKQLAERG